jgi:hypothetical protein
MAGTPKKRDRQLATLLREQGIDPDALRTVSPGVEPLEPGAPGATRAHARARAPVHAREARSFPMGAETRRAVDVRTADDLQALAAQLSPGFTLRIERLRPVWAAGWVEDYPIDDGSLAAVLEYLRDEHGGQVYRGTVLGADESQLYVCKIPVAGPPRRRGRVVTRDAWEGNPSESAAGAAASPVAAPAAAPASQLSDLIALLDAVQRQNTERQEVTLGAVREMVQGTQRSQAELLAALAARGNGNGAGESLHERLQELIQASQAIDELREVIGSGAPAPAAAAAEQSTGMRAVLERAAADMLVQGWQNDQAQQRTRAPAPAAPPVQQRTARFVRADAARRRPAPSSKPQP